MSAARNTAEIIDFTQFRRQKQAPQLAESHPQQDNSPVPTFVWVPVWVLVPQPITY